MKFILFNQNMFRMNHHPSSSSSNQQSAPQKPAVLNESGNSQKEASEEYNCTSGSSPLKQNHIHGGIQSSWAENGISNAPTPAPTETSKQQSAPQKQAVLDESNKSDKEKREECNYNSQCDPITPSSASPVIVKRLIVEAPTKSCPSDPIPTGLLKECLDELLPVITRTINLSLEEGKFPSEWKGALVKPKLKKADLDLIKENFRRLSNLQFLSKLTEKAVAQQTLSHIAALDLFPDLQSAYRRNCSTETALLRVRNDILFNMNRQHITLLVFLDLSAAFDTIDHLALLDLLRDKFGMDGVVSEWFRSYLTDRSQ